jgi:single-strand DNA-binding protein
MNSLNSVLLEGKATNEPKVHLTQTGNTVVSFTISVLRTYKVQEEYKKEVSYFMVEVWGEEAKTAKEKVQYGSWLKITGRLKQDRWIAEDGEHLARVKVMAEHIEYKS